MPCYVIRALDQALDAEPLPSDQIVSGDPQVSAYAILDSKELAVGIWQHTVGVSTDVEVDEIFVVLRGRARVAVTDGPTLELGPGDVGVLEAGAETTWTVTEDLRKVYIARG